MDNVATFGDVVCRISLAESIDQGLLADFRLVAVEVSDAELRSILNRHSVTEPHTDGLRVAAAQVALLKAQYKYDLRRTLTFHSRIAGATVFAETLHETATVMPPALQGPLQTATINSSQSRLERRQAKDQFATVPLNHGSQRLPRAVLTSCRCFAEGVDLPAIDSILFCDPKTSSLDIVQAIGRALRQNPGDGKIATIVVPVYIKPGQDIGEGLKGTAFHFIHEVMIALSTYDEHIFVRLEYYRSLEEEPDVLHPCARPERADEIMPLLALASADSPHAVWELGLDSARRYLETHNNLNVRSRYCGPDRFYLGWWIGKQRSLRKNGLLLQERINALDALGMIWEHPPHSIEYRLQIARDYAARHGHLVPPENETHGGIHLGRWLAQRRSEARQRTLPFCYQRALNEIYPWWTASKWGSTWHHTYAQARLAACRGELPFPDQRPDSDDPPLAGWLDEQIGNLLNLHPDQHDLLGALQLNHPLALLLRRPRSSTGWAFLRGLHAALIFWRSHQHLDVPAGYIGHRGAYIGLARWLDGCRRAPQKLTEDQRHALEALDMRWI